MRRDARPRQGRGASPCVVVCGLPRSALTRACAANFVIRSVHAFEPRLTYLLPIVLLLGSNMFMTLAWYGHLRFKAVPLIGVIMASWLIAFVEYCAAVPANRWGSAVYTTAQLKTIQEVITLLVFAGFSIVYLKEPLTWNYALGFVLIALGAFFVFRGPL
jgi:uncharacterized protein (DUF486 family)